MDGILTAPVRPGLAWGAGPETLLAALKARPVAPGQNLVETPPPEDGRPSEQSLSH